MLCSQTKRSFVFFRMFVLLRSCTILEVFTSFCFVFSNFYNTTIHFTFDFESTGLIPFASLRSSKVLEQPVPEFIDPVFTKTSPKLSISVIQNERFWLVFVKTGFIISGTERFRFDLKSLRNKQFVSCSILLNFGLNSFLLRS